MYIRLGLLLVFLLPVAAFSQFNIKGEIVDSQNIKDLEIFISYGENLSKRFSAEIKEKTFHIAGELAEPVSGMLTIKNAGNDRGIKLLLDNHSTYTVEVLLEDNSNIFGEGWYQIRTNSEFHNVWRNFYDKQAELSANIRKVQDSFEKNLISKKDLDEKILNINAKKNQEFKNLAFEKPSNFAVPYILSGAPDLSQEYLLYYQMLDEDVKNSYWGKILKETLNNFNGTEERNHRSEPLLGSEISTIIGKDVEGKTKILSKENLDSKLTLIDFWASWCVPCRKENIQLGELNKKYDDRDLKIISFSLDSKSENWLKASLKDNISWENISDLAGVKSQTMQDFKIEALPRNVLIDRDGRIIAVNKFGQELTDFVGAFLK